LIREYANTPSALNEISYAEGNEGGFQGAKGDEERRYAARLLCCAKPYCQM